MPLPDITEFGFDGTRTNLVTASGHRPPLSPAPPAHRPVSKAAARSLSPPKPGRALALSPAELKALAYVFARADLNGDGVLDREELESLLLDMGYHLNPEEVDQLMQQIDVGGAQGIEFREFKKAASLWAPLTAQVAVKEKEEPPCATRVPRCGSQVDSAMAQFLSRHGLTEGCARLAESGICLDHLLETSYSKADMQLLTRECGLSRDASNRLTNGLTALRQERIMAARRVGVAVAVSRYADPALCTASHCRAGAQAVADCQLALGYAVHLCHSQLAEPAATPTAANLTALLNGVAMRVECLDTIIQAVTLYFAGNVCIDLDAGDVYLMPSTATADNPCLPGLSLSGIATTFQACGENLILFIDAPHHYELRGDRAAYKGGSLSLVAQGANIVAQVAGQPPLASRLVQAFAAGQTTLRELVASAFGPDAVKGVPTGPSLAEEGKKEKKAKGEAKAKPLGTFQLECLVSGTAPKADFEAQLQRVGWGDPIQLQPAKPLGVVVLSSDVVPGELNSPKVVVEVERELQVMLGLEAVQFELRPAPGGGSIQVWVSLPIPKLEELSAMKCTSPTRQRDDALPRADVPPVKEKDGAGKKKGRAKKGAKKEPDREADMVLWEPALAAVGERLAAYQPGPFATPRVYAKLWYKAVAVVATGTADQCAAIEAAAGTPVLPAVVAVRRPWEGGRHAAKPGVLLTETGDSLASLHLRAYVTRREAQLATRCQRPPLPREIPLPEPRPVRTMQGDDLQMALNSLEDYELLEVPPGTYTVNIVVTARRVTIRGIGDGVVLQGAAAAPTVDVCTNFCQFANVTITNPSDKHPAVLVRQGSPTFSRCHIIGSAGCLRAMAGSEPLLNGCLFTGAVQDSAVIFETQCRGVMEECEVRANAKAGVTLRGFRCNPWLSRCRVVQNSGAGMVVEDEAVGVLVHSTIQGNVCPGLLVETAAAPVVYGCAVLDNQSFGLVIRHGGGLYENNYFCGNTEVEVNLESSDVLLEFRRNRLHAKYSRDPLAKKAEVGLQCDAVATIDHNDMEGYRIGMWIRILLPKTTVRANRICTGRLHPAAVPLQLPTGPRPSVRFNALYHWEGCKAFGETNARVALPECRLVNLVEWGYVAPVAALLGSGVAPNINAADPLCGGNTALTAAIAQRDSVMLGLLLQSHADCTQMDANGLRPLHLAVERGDGAVVRLLLAGGARVDQEGAAGLRPLQTAMAMGGAEMLRLLLESRANPNQYDRQSDSPLLHQAVQKQRLDLMDLLVEFDADVNLGNSRGHTALLLATEQLHSPSIIWLLDHLADPHQSTLEHDSPFFLATRRGQTKIVDLFLKRGANVQACTPDGSTALHMACETGVTAFVQLLLKANAAPGTPNCAGETPLHRALQFGHVPVAKALLAARADPEAVDRQGCTPFCEIGLDLKDALLGTKLQQFFEVLRLPDNFDKLQALAKTKDWDPNVRGLRGWTPLMQTMLFANRRAMAFLFEKGARPYTPANNSFTALLWANWVGADSVQNTLKSLKLKCSPEDAHALARLERACKDKESAEAKLLQWTAGGQLTLAKQLEHPEIAAWCSLAPTRSVPCAAAMWVRQEMALLAVHFLERHEPHSARGPATVVTTPDELLSFLAELGRNRALWPIAAPTGKGVFAGTGMNPPMDVLLFEASFALASSVAAGCNLAAEHYLALYLFTCESMIYRLVQNALRSDDADDEQYLRPFLDCLLQALEALPDYRMPCYIATSLPVDVDEYAQHVDQVLRFPTLVSATADYGALRRWMKEGESTVFVVQPRHAKHVAPYTSHPLCQEVVFLPGTCFRVAAVYTASPEELEHRRYAEYRKKLATMAGEPGKLPEAIVELVEV
eukprot:EG_transcript_147